MSDFRMTMVTHACVKLEGHFGALLCDPWFLNEPIYNFSTWKYPLASMPADEVVAGVTHVFISHSHEDHFHIPSIDLLPRNVMMLLPDYAWHPGNRSHTVERTIRALGFTNIRLLHAWETVALAPDLQVTVIPSAASKARDWENAGLVIEHPSAKILNMNDCPSDEALYQEVNRRFGSFDLMLIQYAGVSIFPGRFRMSREALDKAVANKRANFQEQKRAVEMLTMKALVPFAGDFSWLDDRLFHCNWSCRATPRLFEDWMRDNYPDRNIELLMMNPSDEWTPGNGLRRQHPLIDWNGYVDDIAAIKQRFQPKIDAINHWLAASDRRDLKARSATFLETLERIGEGRQDIDFTVRFRFVIEGDDADFSFVLSADPVEGFRVLWDDDAPTDQTFYLPQDMWASVLSAKTMMGMISWPGEIVQHVPFRLDLARFWFWLEYYGDLVNRSPQALIDTRLHPGLTEAIRPQLGVL